MAKLILEIQTRGLNQYHHLENFPVTIGRALDNDIILSDNSVSAHHLKIDRNEDGQLFIQNLSDENGTTMNRHMLGKQPVSAVAPVRLVLGNRKMCLLSSDMAVEIASIRRCSGIFSMLCNPVWAVLLLAATIFALVADNYLSTTLMKGTLFYLTNLLPNILALLAVTLLISGITRLVTHRWELIPALSIASLFTLIPIVLYEMGHWFDYWLTSDTVSSVLLTLSDFLLLPVLLYIFLRKVNHQRPWPALGVAFLLSSPLIAYQGINLLDQITQDSEFSADPAYNQTLSSLNMHAAPTVSINAYFKEVQDSLPPAKE